MNHYCQSEKNVTGKAEPIRDESGVNLVTPLLAKFLAAEVEKRLLVCWVCPDLAIASCLDFLR